MRWQELDVLPPLDHLVLLWLEDGPVLARRVEGDKFGESPGWYWQLEGEFDDASAAAPLRWANVIPPRIA